MVPINKITFNSRLFIQLLKSLNSNIGYIRLRTPLYKKKQNNEVVQCIYTK